MNESKFKQNLVIGLAVTFVITGLIAIIYQQIFEKILGAIIGTSLVSSSTVLGIFFVGIATGSLCYNIILQYFLKTPLKVFVVGECVVGLWGVMAFFCFDFLNMWSYSIMQYFGATGIRFFFGTMIISCGWVLPSTFAMGLSFPAIVGILKSIGLSNLNLHISRFYAFNLLGATIGTLAGVYWWFPRLGLMQTLLLLSVLEILISVMAFFIVRDFLSHFPVKAVRSIKNKYMFYGMKSVLRNSHWVLLLVSFFSGFIVFSYEVLWNHLIAVTLGNSVYSFANMLFAVLLGLLIAALINSGIFKKVNVIPNGYVTSMIQISAILLCISFLYWDDIPSWLAESGRKIPDTVLSPFAFGELVRLKYCILFITVPSIFLGMIYPFLFRSQWFPDSDSDQTVALMSAINALGSLSGALLTIFVFIPVFGSQSSFKWLAVLFSFIAIVCLIYDFVKNRPTLTAVWRLAPLLQCAIFLACIMLAYTSSWDILELTSGKNVYFSQSHVTKQSKLLFVKEGITDGFVTVVKKQGTSVLLTNGKFQGNDTGEVLAQISFAMLPILHVPKTDNAAVIGFGTGMSAAVIKAAGFKSVDIMELSPGIVKAASTCFSHINRNVLKKQGVSLHLADGRTYLLVSDTIYDLISIEISSIWFAGATNIYSREFYAIAKAKLTDKGVLQQWVQFHHIGLTEVLATIATVRSVFPFVSVWIFGGQGIILASESPLAVNDTIKQTIEANKEMAYFLNKLNTPGASLEKLLSYKLLGMADVDTLYQETVNQGMPLNTDRNRYLEFHTPRYNLEKKNHRLLIVNELLRRKL
ncbi:hypothetical protein QUF75_03895 [Desulfococcaceae bacterium HSG7]|nr:hypothetical protein [Desulfococcaceae bacterium HSG7]